MAITFDAISTRELGHWTHVWEIWLWFQMCQFHQMELFFVLLVLCKGNSLVTGRSLSQKPVKQTFVFFDLRLNKRLSKQSRCRWFETPSLSLWRHVQLGYWYLEYASKHQPGMVARGFRWWWVNTGSGNGMVPSGKKPLLEPALAHSLSPFGVTKSQWLR